VFTGTIERRVRASSRTDHYVLACSGGWEVSINARSDVPPSDVEYAVVAIGIARYRNDDGVWQDGGLIVGTTAILLRFRSQSWQTDDRTGHAR
jgi:hypothetical protein